MTTENALSIFQASSPDDCFSVLGPISPDLANGRTGIAV